MLPLHMPIWLIRSSAVFTLRSMRVKILLPSPFMIELWQRLQSCFVNSSCPAFASPSGKGSADAAVAAHNRIKAALSFIAGFMISSPLSGLQMGDAHHGRRVRIVERRIKRVGGPCGGGVL